MKIIVTGKNITISDRIQSAIDKKFEKLGKFFADDIKANIVIHPERDKVKMEATIVTREPYSGRKMFRRISLTASISLQRSFPARWRNIRANYRNAINPESRFDLR